MPVLKASVVPGYLTNARGRTRVVVHLTGPEEELGAQGCCSCSLHVNENRQQRRKLEQGSGAQQAAGDGRSSAGRGPTGGGRRGGCPCSIGQGSSSDSRQRATVNRRGATTEAEGEVDAARTAAARERRLQRGADGAAPAVAGYEARTRKQRGGVAVEESRRGGARRSRGRKGRVEGLLPWRRS